MGGRLRSDSRDSPLVAALPTSRISRGSLELFAFMKSGSLHDECTLKENEFIAFLAPRVHLRMYPNAVAQRTHVPAYLHIIIMTQAVISLCIGTFLTNAVLYYNRVHGLDAQLVGILLACGEGTSVLTISISWLLQLLQASRAGNAVSLLDVLLSRPLHIPIMVMSVGTATVLFNIPSLAIAIPFQIIFEALYDTNVSLLNELTATSIPADSFKVSQSLGQVLRLLGNMLSAFTGPLLFSITPSLPFLVYGFVVFFWGLLVVWPTLYCRARTIARDMPVGRFPPVTAFWHFAGSIQWHEVEQAFHDSKKKLAENLRSASPQEEIMKYQLAQLSAATQSKESEIDDLKLKVARLERGLEAISARPPPPSLPASPPRRSALGCLGPLTRVVCS